MRASRIPVLFLKFGLKAEGRKNESVFFAPVSPFAINRLARGNYNFFDGVFSGRKQFKDLCRASSIDIEIFRDFGSKAAESALVEKEVDSLKGLAKSGFAPNVPFNELSVRVQPAGLALGVSLGLEIIENRHFIAGLNQEVNQVRANQPRSPGHKRTALPAAH